MTATAPTANLLDAQYQFLPAVNVVSFAGPGMKQGMSASLEPVVKRLNARVNWFALTDHPQDQAQNQAESRKKGSGPGFSYYTPKLSTGLMARLLDDYKTMAQGYLWSLLHGDPHKYPFDLKIWKSFKQLSQAVAGECLNSSTMSFPSLCWLHDYQLAMGAPALASQSGIILCQFWHVPFPSAAVMQQSPIGAELTQALLQNKLIGFHTERYASNFLDTVEAFFPEAKIDRALKVVSLGRKQTRVAVMPLGVDSSYWQKLAMDSKPHAEALARTHGLAQQYIVGIDKLDYTKGIIERLNGLDLFLATHPEMLKRFHYVQLSQPNQGASEEHKQYEILVDKRISAINTRFGDADWQPILHIKEHLGHAKLSAWYQSATALSINSLSDGLNLLAKEFVASRIDESGVLILSKATGAAEELGQGAILVDPTDPAAISAAFAQALSLTWEEKHNRMVGMRQTIGWNQLIGWAMGFLGQALAE